MHQGETVEKILRTLIINKPLHRFSVCSLMKAAEILIHAGSSPNNNLLCAVFAEKAEVPG